MSFTGSPTGSSEGPFEPMATLFEDLEQQAEALQLAERDAEVADRAQGEYAAVALAARLHASVGMHVRLGVVGVGRLEGQVRRVGPEWLGVRGARGGVTEGPAFDWIVRIAALRTVQGASELAVSEAARSVTARLGIGSVLRSLARSRAAVLVHHLDGSSCSGVIGRVGADFVELVRHSEPGENESRAELVSLRWVAAFRSS